MSEELTTFSEKMKNFMYRKYNYIHHSFMNVNRQTLLITINAGSISLVPSEFVQSGCLLHVHYINASKKFSELVFNQIYFINFS